MKDLFETPIAAYGDWEGFKEPIQITKTVFKLYWEIIDAVTIKDQKYIIVKLKNDVVWAVGKLEKVTKKTKLGDEIVEEFHVYFRIEFDSNNYDIDKKEHIILILSKVF